MRKRKNTVTALSRRYQKNYTSLKLLVMSGLLLAVMFLVLIAVQAIQYNQVQKRAAALQQQVEEAAARNELVKEEISRLHDPDYLEVLARKLLGFVKPGETVYRFED